MNEKCREFADVADDVDSLTLSSSNQKFNAIWMDARINGNQKQLAMDIGYSITSTDTSVRTIMTPERLSDLSHIAILNRSFSKS